MDVIPFIDDYNICVALVKDSIECMTRKMLSLRFL